MPLTICFYEDDKYGNFFPLTHLRPVYNLRAGVVPLCERARRYFEKAEFVFCCRDHLAKSLAITEKNYPVNIIKKTQADILFLNGRIRDYGDLPKLILESRISTIYQNNNETIALLLKNDVVRNMPAVATPTDYTQLVNKEGEDIPDFHTTATLYNYIWEIMGDVEKEIVADVEFWKKNMPRPENLKIHEGVYWSGQENVFLGGGVEILPAAVIDASRGPVFVGSNTRIEPHAAVIGPCYIGPNSIVVAGKISTSSIGHTCRVGGEVEHSIFHSYVNKYHAGFIGHSYVGSWVNFGAMTTNSDLKNNYSNISVSIKGRQLDTGSNKVGSFIGDHTKFGIGTLLNTGINIGVCCNVFGGGLVSDREVADFSWGSTGKWVGYDLIKAVETARAVTKRRGYSLSMAEEELLKLVADGSDNDIGVLKFGC